MHLRHTWLSFCFLLGVFHAPGLSATPVTLYKSLAGNLDFVMGGGTLRTGANGVLPCAVTNGPVSGNISGIPVGSTVEAAYLYWGGSGDSAAADYDVTFNGTAVTADRTFDDVFTFNGTDYDFFSGFKDVTAQVTGNGNYTFADLTPNSGNPFCPVSAVLSGWALVVVYSNPAEDFRVVNVFDGLAFYRGTSLALTPNNFVIPPSPVNGKLGVISWEGDVENSAPLGGFSENILMNGSPLTDAANPSNNQFNSTINIYNNSNNFYGVDIDLYDITPFINGGDTSANTIYQTGADLVFLNAEVISVSNTPVSDLSVQKSHTGDFYVNTNGQFQISVTNNGPIATSGVTTVTDTLPAGLSYVSAAGTGWSCSHAAGVVTCTSSSVIANGANAPPITLTVAVDNDAYPSVTNPVNVSGSNFDNISGNDDDTDLVTVQPPDLTSSSKSVVDVNGGQPDPGDTLRYIITIDNASFAPATIVAVADDIPALTTGFSVVSIPAGATDNSTGTGTGANGTGFLSLGNLSIPANSSVAIVFDVTIAGSASPGDLIDNTATITPPVGAAVNVSAPSVIVSPSAIPSTGNKDIYLHTPTRGGGFASREVPTGTNFAQINGNGALRNFDLEPVLAGGLTISAGNVPVTLQMRRAGNGANDRVVEVQLQYENAAGTYVTLGSQQQTISMTTTFAEYTFAINVPADTPVLQGRDIRFVVVNNSSSNNRRIRIESNAGDISKYVFLVTPVINIQSIQTFDAAYPGGTAATTYGPGQTVYVRAVVSDPFGSDDITGAVVSISDPVAGTLVSAQAMSSVATTAGTRTYEFSYVIPATGNAGNWDVSITANEGSEGTISDTLSSAFIVSLAELTIAKSNTLISDPVNGTTNPKRIPGAVVRYEINVSNETTGSPSSDSVFVTDPLPPQAKLCVTSACSGGGNPVVFIDGTPSSNLSMNFPSAVSYSSNPGGVPPYAYLPTPDSDGYDASVTGIRVDLGGTMAASTGSAPHPGFQIQIRMQIK